MPKTSHAVRPAARARTRAARIALLLVLALVLGYLALRHGGGVALRYWLENQPDSEITLERLDLDPFTGRLELGGLEIATDRGGRIRAPRAELRVSLASLWRAAPAVVIEQLTLIGLDLGFEQTAGGWRLSGLPRWPDSGSGNGDWSVTIIGAEIRASRAQMETEELTSEFGIESARFHGRLAQRDGALVFGFEGGLEARAITVALGGERRVQVAGLTAGELRLDSAGQVDAGRLALTDLRLSSGPPARAPILTAPRAEVAALRADAGRVALTGVRLHNPTARLERTAGGRLAGWRAFFAGTGDDDAYAVAIDELAVTGPAPVEIHDATVQPPLRERLTIDALTLRGIDTGRADQEIGLSLDGGMGRYGRIGLTATLRPRPDGLAADLAARVERLELPPFSPYSILALGQQLSSGQLEAQLDAAVRAGQIDGSVEMRLIGLKVEPRPGPALRRLQERLTLPLDMALSTLRDRHDNIRLTLPLSGDIRDPRFDYGDAVNQAVSRALRAAALTYLKYYFQPFGTLISVVELAGNVTALRLDPMAFAPASAALDAATHDYLARVAGLISERPGLSLRLCGEAAPADAAAGSGDLAALARERAERVRDHLVETGGLDPGRLLVCVPRVSDRPDAVPRVELQI